jgi:NAD(P)-dependent dehydrogenase (short-subunit alcohol dehydrogenase family)
MGGGMFDLDGKSVIVTGSGRGLGKTISKGLAGLGASLVVCSRTAEEAESTAAEIQSDGGNAVAVTTDIADRDSCKHLVEVAVDRFGGVDVLVNNAGITSIEPAEEAKPESWSKLLDVNLTGYFHCSQFAAGAMLADSRQGSIVNVSSVAAFVGIPGLLSYSAAKAGVNQMTRSMAVEWATRGIRVNAIAPGYIANVMRDAAADLAKAEKQEEITRLTPMERLGLPEELVGPVAFLASDASAYVTGTVLPVDGGYTAL